MRARAPFALALALFAVAGCKRDRGGDERAQPALPPLAAPATATLPVTGFGESVVAPPVGATRPMPIVVAVLGIGDTPEEQCAAWRDVVASRAFVLCPRGAPNMVTEEVDPDDGGAEPTVASDGDEEKAERPAREAGATQSGRQRQVGYYPIDVASVEREVVTGLAALKARYGAHVDEKNVVYAGFSRGAFLGASLAAKQPGRFARAVLIEGGQSPWRAESATAFARGGGKRVLFVCGQPSCVAEAEAAAATLRAQKIETRIVHGAGEGHGYKKQVKEELRRSFDWVTEGEPAWAASQLVAR